MAIIKKLGVLLTFFSLALSLPGCAPKAMETFSAWQPEITLYAGDTWEADIPTDGEAAAYSISVNNVPGLRAELSGNTLRLTATQAGDGQITLAATAKGYQDTNLTIPIRVESHELDLEWSVAPLEEPEEGADPPVWRDNDTAALLIKETAVLSFRETAEPGVLTDARLSAELSPPDLATVELGDGVVHIDAGESFGTGTLTVTARKENYEDTVLSIPVAIVRGRLPLSLTSGGYPLDRIDLENGYSAAITVVTGEGAEVQVKMEGEAATVSHNAGKSYAVVSAKPGESQLVITASGEGWLDGTLTVPVSISKTRATVTPAATEVSIEPGESKDITFTTKPQGAKVTASVADGGFTAEVSGSTLTITAGEEAEGKAEVTLTASAEDYADGSSSVTAAAKLEPISLSLALSTLTIEEGGTDSLLYTVTPDKCSLTVSASEGISAKCENGSLVITAQQSGTVTVTATRSGRDPASATVKVNTIEPLPDVDTDTYAEDMEAIIRITNDYRQSKGLDRLTHISVLDTPATIRAEEAAEYWAHTRPDGTSFNTVFTQCGLKYAAYGENLFSVNTRYSAADVVQAWKDSPTHDENLLRQSFTGIGVGVVRVNGEYYYCQLFIQE